LGPCDFRDLDLNVVKLLHAKAMPVLLLTAADIET